MAAFHPKRMLMPSNAIRIVELVRIVKFEVDLWDLKVIYF